MGRSGRCPRDDWRELSRPPSVRHPEDRGVLQEKVGVATGPTDPRTERELSSGPQGEGPASETARFQVVRPDEVGAAAVAADRGQSRHLTRSSGGPHVKIVTQPDKTGTRLPTLGPPEGPSSLLTVRSPG